MERTVVIGGFGGQGLLFTGQVLAGAALLEDREVLWMPSYGPEMRGGTASSTVIIADRPIGSPIVDVADCVIALNLPSLARFEPLLGVGGLLVLNSSLVDRRPRRRGLEVLALPCTALAREAGEDRLVSVVALGGFAGRRPIVRPESIRTALRDAVAHLRPSMIEANLAAFDAGLAAA